MKLPIVFQELNHEIKISFSQIDSFMEVDFGSIMVVTHTIGKADEYTGSYNITPDIDKQVMSTKNKMMVDDVTINGIPYFETSNDAGGNTIYIGKEI